MPADPPDELAARRQQQYLWKAVMDDYTHPRCRCTVTPLEPDARPWYKRVLSWARVRWVLWRYRRATGSALASPRERDR